MKICCSRSNGLGFGGRTCRVNGAKCSGGATRTGRVMCECERVGFGHFIFFKAIFDCGMETRAMLMIIFLFSQN